MAPTQQIQIQRLNYKLRRNRFTDNQTLERKRTTTNGNCKITKRNGSYKTKEILKRRIVNLSDIQLTQSETDLLQKGLNFCPTPRLPTIDNINKDIDTFARRLSLREYHTPENIDEITDNPSYQPTILEKLNHWEQKPYCRPSREPYLNTYIEKLRQEITDRTVYNRRFQRSNLSKRERLALDRLSNNRDIIIKPADKGGATVILNTIDYLQEAKRQLDNDMYYKRIEEDCTSGHEQTINHCIDDLVKNGEIQHDVAKLLKPAQSRTPIFYMLPKIHKINNPGRPIISSVNSHTEKISAYGDIS